MIITVTLNPTIDKTLEIPGFAPGRTLKARTIRRQPAGKGVNVSRVLAALGVPSVATGILGDAELPAYRRSFEAPPPGGRRVAEVRLEFVTIPSDTRQNTTILDPGGGPETHVREEGFAVGAAEIDAFGRKLRKLARPGDLVVFAGSLPPGATPEHLAGLVRSSSEAGCGTAVDTSGAALAAAVEAGCTIAKPNLEELGELTGGHIESAADAARAAESLRGKIVLLVTMGAEGACCFAAGDSLRGKVELEGAVNTVGAGDAFLAGFLAAYTMRQPLPDCLRLAVACGGASTLERWAGEINVDVVRRLAERTLIERI